MTDVTPHQRPRIGPAAAQACHSLEVPMEARSPSKLAATQGLLERRRGHVLMMTAVGVAKAMAEIKARRGDDCIFTSDEMLACLDGCDLTPDFVVVLSAMLLNLEDFDPDHKKHQDQKRGRVLSDSSHKHHRANKAAALELWAAMPSGTTKKAAAEVIAKQLKAVSAVTVRDWLRNQ